MSFHKERKAFLLKTRFKQQKNVFTLAHTFHTCSMFSQFPYGFYFLVMFIEFRWSSLFFIDSHWFLHDFQFSQRFLPGFIDSHGFLQDVIVFFMISVGFQRFLNDFCWISKIPRWFLQGFIDFSIISAGFHRFVLYFCRIS